MNSFLGGGHAWGPCMHLSECGARVWPRASVPQKPPLGCSGPSAQGDGGVERRCCFQPAPPLLGTGQIINSTLSLSGLLAHHASPRSVSPTRPCSLSGGLCAGPLPWQASVSPGLFPLWPTCLGPVWLGGQHSPPGSGPPLFPGAGGVRGRGKGLLGSQGCWARLKGLCWSCEAICLGGG